MASWMIHLRIADRLMDRIPDLDETAFVMGNIAPDSDFTLQNGKEKLRPFFSEIQKDLYVDALEVTNSFRYAFLKNT